MKLFTGFFMIAVLFTTVVNAQNSKVVTASSALFNEEYAKAKEAIDEAILNEKTMGQAKTWFYRGQIYNRIAMDTTGEFSNVADPVGVALESFKNALNMPDVKNYKTDIGAELFTTYNLYFSRGATAYSAGDSEAAYVNFAKAHEANLLQIDAFPLAVLDTGVIFNMGLMAERTGRTTEAVAAYQKLVEMKYSETYLYSKLSNIYLEAGRTADALAILEEGRRNFPKDPEIITAELNYYLSQNKLDVLVSKLENAISLDPKNTELYFVLGTTNSELIKLDSMNAQQHFEAAIKAYDKALALNPERFDINLNAGALYYNTAIEINKTMNALPLEKEAEYQKLSVERNKLYMQALPYFEKGHQIDPKNTDCMLALKEIYVRTNQKEKAEEMKQLLGN
ncbi:MAG: tetratricopeptide repeat protein [Bacteroidetes bacterium]|nr:tetratricopeptide repeat protein [Bacteroidota bacterium]MBP8916481.1 tetratricopeptide repeat protein [Chitinophagales bacterium]